MNILYDETLRFPSFLLGAPILFVKGCLNGFLSFSMGSYPFLGGSLRDPYPFLGVPIFLFKGWELFLVLPILKNPDIILMAVLRWS